MMSIMMSKMVSRKVIGLSASLNAVNTLCMCARCDVPCRRRTTTLPACEEAVHVKTPHCWVGAMDLEYRVGCREYRVTVEVSLSSHLGVASTCHELPAQTNDHA